MRKILVAGAAGAAALAVGGFALGERYAQSQLEAGIAELRGNLGSDGSLTYASAEASFLRRSATIRGVEIRKGQMVARAEDVVVSGFAGGSGSASARNLRLESRDAVVSAATASFENLVLPPTGGRGSILQAQMDELRLGGLKVEAEGRETTVGSASLTAYGPGRRSSLSVSQISTPASGHPGLDHVTAGSLSLSGIDLYSLVAGVASLDGGRGLAWTPGASAFEARDLAAFRRGERVASLGRALASADRTAGGATSFSLVMSDSWGRPTPAVMAQLAPLGYEEIRSDISVRASHDPVTRRLDFGPVSLRSQNMFDISFRVELGAVPNPQAGQPRARDLLGTELVSATVRYVDLSLFDRAVAAAARQTGMSAEAVRLQASQIAGASSGFSPQSPAERAIRDALVSFVAKPGEIEFTAKPDRPLPLAAIVAASRAPHLLVDLLRLTATAK